jgi:DNA-binding transcriptional LysR family regulator
MPDRLLDVANIEIRYLRYFLVVAEERHFSRAAHRLGIAQPPLSQQIQRLEELVGQKLLNRRPSVSLTAAGEVLAEAAAKLIRQLQLDIVKTRRTGSGHIGSLTIGFPASALMTWFPQVVRRFREVYPEVELILKELSSAAQLASLAEGSIDVGLLRGSVSNDLLQCETLLSEPFAAVVPESHPLASRRSIDLNDLAEQQFVLFPRSVAPALHDEITVLFRGAGVDPPVIMEAQEWLTIVGLVETGIGLSIVPASFRRLRWGNVRYLLLKNVGAQTSITICTPRDGATPAAERFLEVVRAHRQALDTN